LDGIQFYLPSTKVWSGVFNAPPLCLTVSWYEEKCARDLEVEKHEMLALEFSSAFEHLGKDFRSASASASAINYHFYY
jgi:hypothetical protein